MVFFSCQASLSWFQVRNVMSILFKLQLLD